MKEEMRRIRVEEIDKKEQKEESDARKEEIKAWIKNHYTPEGGAPALLRLFGISKGAISTEGIAHTAHVEGGRVTMSIEGLEGFAESLAKYIANLTQTLQLPKEILHYHDIIHPPGSGQLQEPSSEDPEKKETKPPIPRTLFFLQLMAEMQMQCVVMQGEENGEIMRTEGYQTFYLAEPINKFVSINNAWGEATFIRFQAKSQEVGDWISFVSLKKEDMKENEHIGRMIWTGSGESWKAALYRMLHQETPDPADVPIRKVIDDYLKTSDKAMDVLLPSLLAHSPPFAVRYPSRYPGDPGPVRITREGLEYLRTIIPGKDWLSATNIKKELEKRVGSGDALTIRKRIEALQKEYPQDILEKEGKGLYASPRIRELVIKEFLARRKPPEGWKTYRATAKSLIKLDETVGIHEVTLRRMIGRLKEQGKEVEEETYTDDIGHMRPHIGPKGFAVLQNALRSGEIR